MTCDTTISAHERKARTKKIGRLRHHEQDHAPAQARKIGSLEQNQPIGTVIQRTRTGWVTHEREELDRSETTESGFRGVA
jgi:hypothetical protein